ncbi:hypothetical protein U719_15690 [Exiguobacterium sp. MH3]|nr:hypothetical protein U719_15690 [Exiguobacterium sp. MH3]
MSYLLTGLRPWILRQSFLSLLLQDEACFLLKEATDEEF